MKKSLLLDDGCEKKSMPEIEFVDEDCVEGIPDWIEGADNWTVDVAEWTVGLLSKEEKGSLFFSTIGV